MAVWRLDLAELSAPGATGIGTVLRRQNLLTSVNDLGQYLKFSYALNGPGGIEFTLPIDKPTRADYAVGQRELHLYRDGVLVWGGYLVRSEIDNAFVRFGGLGWLWKVRRRHVDFDLWYRDTEPTSIAWQLIDWMQDQPNGNLGITLQTNPLPTPGAVKSVLYCGHERSNIGDAIDDMAEMKDGFDYDVSPAKVFQVWAPGRGTVRAIEIDAGRQTTSLTGITEDVSELVTELSVLGPRESCSDDNGLTLRHDPSVAKYGLLQGEVQYDNTDARIRTSKGDAELEALRRINVQPKVEFQRSGLPGELAWGAVGLGDTVRFKSANGYATYNLLCRVISQEYEVRPGGVERWAWQLDGDL